ncbi:MAG: type IV toxin-antitoxin system AbiEi family antitoxin [Microbacterium sp.]
MAPTHAPRFVYFAHDRFSPAELSAARLDGHLVELGEGFVPADAVETPALRAASLAPLVDDRLAATHLSAAWVHGAVDEPPAQHAVQRAVGHRIRPVVDHRVVYRDVQLDARDVVRIGGVLVTTPVRTLADLARQSASGPDGAQVAEAISRLAAHAGAAREGIARLAQQDAVPGKPHALELLRALERSAAKTS